MSSRENLSPLDEAFFDKFCNCLGHHQARKRDFGLKASDFLPVAGTPNYLGRCAARALDIGALKIRDYEFIRRILNERLSLQDYSYIINRFVFLRVCAAFHWPIYGALGYYLTKFLAN